VWTSSAAAAAARIINALMLAACSLCGLAYGLRSAKIPRLTVSPGLKYKPDLPVRDIYSILAMKQLASFASLGIEI